MSLSYDFSCLSKVSIFYPKTATSLHQAEVPAQPCYHSQQFEEPCIFLTGPHTLPSSPPGTGLSVQLTELITRQKLQLGSSCYTAHWTLVKRVNVINMCPETSAHIPTHVHSPAPYSYSVLEGTYWCTLLSRKTNVPCPHNTVPTVQVEKETLKHFKLTQPHELWSWILRAWITCLELYGRDYREFI